MLVQLTATADYISADYSRLAYFQRHDVFDERFGIGLPAVFIFKQRSHFHWLQKALQCFTLLIEYGIWLQ